MVATHRIRRPLLVALGFVLASTAGSALAEEEAKTGTNPDCFFHRGTDGTVWVGVPLVSLGMIGVGGQPQVRLSKELAEQYAPLVNTLAEPQDGRFWWWHQIPRARGSRDPTILVSMDYRARVLPDELTKESKSSEPRHVDEIVAAEITQLEIVPRVWLSAWDQLSAALHEIDATSFTVPSAEKRARLSAAIERGSRAAASMRRIEPSAAELESVRSAAPQAQIVRRVRYGIESEWNRALGIDAWTLAIEPTTPLIRERAPCSYQQRVQFLLAAESQKAFVAMLRNSCSPEKLDDVLDDRRLRATGTPHEPMLLPLYARQVESLTPDEFRTLRSELGERRRDELQEQSPSSPRPGQVTAPIAGRVNHQTRYAETVEAYWGVVLRPASADELAEKLLLGGYVVEKLRASGSPLGLRPGDLLMDYSHALDAPIGNQSPFGGLRRFADLARHGGELRVLRATELITHVIEPERRPQPPW